jgi:hypothetical protein
METVELDKLRNLLHIIGIEKYRTDYNWEEYTITESIENSSKLILTIYLSEDSINISYISPAYAKNFGRYNDIKQVIEKLNKYFIHIIRKHKIDKLINNG